MTFSPDNPASLGDLVIEASDIFQPPERLTVAEAAEKYVKLHNPPVYIGPYKNSEAPYMAEPMNMSMSREHTGLVFVGSAQSAKTQGLLLNTMAYVIRCNPMDAILYCPSQAAARDFSKRRIDRLHRHSPKIRDELLGGQHADNTYDKFYRSGMMLTLSWPSVVEMAGKPVPITALTDYDRMPLDIDGEGSPFDLARMRTTTFRSMAMTIAESSPSNDITDPRWRPKPETPHEAPPCEGVLALYNRGDRRRWYWPCPKCGQFFEGKFEHLRWDNNGDPTKCAKTVWMQCPRNGCRIEQQSRYEMNLRGEWLREGETIDAYGTRGGEGIVSEIASFWLQGVAAGFSTWQRILLKFLQAEKEYQSNGSQEALKTTTNTDQGNPYLPRGMESVRSADELKDQAEALPEREVPEDVRCLFATVDVQKNMWVVQVHGIAVGNPYDIVVVDRFNIVKSKRLDPDGEKLWVKPATHIEDWDLIEEEVMNKRYPLANGKGTMGVSMTVCDSGGREGVTSNAYAYYKKLKLAGKADSFLLAKGDSNPNAPRVRISYPDSARKDRKAKARGEVPVLFLQPNTIKDTLHAMMPVTEDRVVEIDDGSQQRETIFHTRVHFPDWLDRSFFEELTAETRTAKGWENLLKRRNEAWDLLTYCVALCTHRRMDHVSWDEPPAWALPWNQGNPAVQVDVPDTPVAEPRKTQYGLAQLGEALG